MSNDHEVNRLDLESLEFHQNVYEGYLKICDLYSDRIQKINAALSPDEVYEQVYQKVKELL